MHVTIELPDELAQRLQTKWQETPAHIARELVVLEAYRVGMLTTREVQAILGLDDRFAVYALCDKYQIATATLADLHRDRDTTHRLGF
jgi:Uncharacterised protein family (UPF0175)